MSKQQPGQPGKTRVVVLVEETGGNTVRVESTQPGKASAIITALDRTFAAYSDDIETETRTWVDLADGLFSAFRHAFKLPSAKTVMSRHQRDVQLDQRQEDLDKRERGLDAKGSGLEVREALLVEAREALDKQADDLAVRESRPIAVTGESVIVPLDGPVTVRVNINDLVYTYTETDVSRELVDPANVKAVLTYHANAWNWDTATGLPDRQVAERILDYISGLISMNAEIKGAGNVLPEDLETPEPVEVRTFHDDGVPVLNLDDAEPTVGTGPITTVHITPLDESGSPSGPTQTHQAKAVELIRKRDRNLT
jgi:hypothetical protein